MIKIKDFSVFESLLVCRYHLKLIDVMKWICTEYPNTTITCGFRRGDAGTHGVTPCRALDLRSSDYPNPSEVEARINENWAYDPQRQDMKVALLHNAGSGMHFHIQVHDRTTKK